MQSIWASGLWDKYPRDMDRERLNREAIRCPASCNIEHGGDCKVTNQKELDGRPMSCPRQR